METRAELKARAKQGLAGKWGIAIGTALVAGLILGALSFSGIGMLLLEGPLMVGVAIVYMEIVRGWQCEFGDMFKGFNNFGTNCLAGILQGLYIALWSMLFVIPGIVKAYSYSMTYYILADHPELSANQAITESRRMMNGHKWELFVLELSFFWWYCLCVCTFGLASFYVGPYVRATTVAFYDSLKAREEAMNAPVDYAAPASEAPVVEETPAAEESAPVAEPVLNGEPAEIKEENPDEQ